MLLTNHTKGVQRGTKTAKTLGFSRNTVLVRIRDTLKKVSKVLLYIYKVVCCQPKKDTEKHVVEIITLEITCYTDKTRGYGLHCLLDK